MADKSPSLHLFADVLARVHVICAALASDGDMATNAAMVLAKEAKTKPRDLAEAIATRLRADPLVEKVDVAGPGFINLTLKPAAWTDALRTVLREGESFGRAASTAS